MPRSAADEIVWPTGGFQWTPELRAKLPIVRGINAPPLKAPWPLVSSLVELEKALDGQFPGAKSGLSWGETETLARQYALLRHSIACAAQAEYENALAVASKLQSRGIVHKFACTYLFPHIEAWATEYLEAGQQFEALLALNSILPLRKVLATLERYTWVFSNSYYFSQFSSSPIYLQIHLHGEQALDLLDLGVRHGTMTLPLYGRMHSPQTIPRLVPHMEKREAREALEELAKHYPAAVMKTAMEHAAATRSATNDRWTVRLAMAHVDAQPAALAALDEASRTKFQTLLAALDCKEADPAQVPDLLLNPPWRQKVRPPAPPKLDIQAIPTEERVEWSPEQRQQLSQYSPRARWFQKEQPTPASILETLGIGPAARLRVLGGVAVQAADIGNPTYLGYVYPDLLFYLPPPVALAIWNIYSWPNKSDHTAPITALLAKHGTAAIPGLLSYTSAYPEQGLEIAAPIDTPRLVPIALHALNRSKKAKAAAIAWIRAHLGTVANTILPLALGADKAAAQDARVGLYWLAESGLDEAVKKVAAQYGETVIAGLRSLNPLNLLPSKTPKLPTFFVPGSFTRPRLLSGAALPLAAVENIGVMLAISKVETPYAGLKTVREACNPDSLAEFAWDLFQAWTEAGSPAKEGWAFLALGLLGNDETAHRLVPKIREWPGESAHARAVLGLDLLAAIGTDVALMHLNAIASKSKHKPLQERAKEKIALVAEARGFTSEELADRLVPDLGLDETGTLALDFGPRKFFVAFDETLKPYVKDAQGTRLKDLPKPVKTDDSALAESAVETYKRLKKDAKATASLQLLRLEMSMITRRRWPVLEFKRFFLQQPLLRYMAARLVWGVYSDGAAVQTFRICEDWTLADQNDVTYVLPDEATVGITHVLEMPSTAVTAFAQIFADYEILQPFRQLGRETYTLTADELNATAITRYKDKVVSTGSVLGLANRGWQRGQAQDAGWVGEFNKRVGPDWQVDLRLDPGAAVGDLTLNPNQKLPQIVLRKRGTWDDTGLLPFSRLDPILISEVLRDVELLAPVKT